MPALSMFMVYRGCSMRRVNLWLPAHMRALRPPEGWKDLNTTSAQRSALLAGALYLGRQVCCVVGVVTCTAANK